MSWCQSILKVAFKAKLRAVNLLSCPFSEKLRVVSSLIAFIDDDRHKGHKVINESHFCELCSKLCMPGKHPLIYFFILRFIS